MKKIIVFIMTFTLLITSVYPAMKKVGTTGLQFLKIDASPRASAMGGAYTMIGFDAAGVFSNPAGIALSESKIDVFMGRTEWFADISFNALAAIIKMGTLGTVGFSFRNSDYGDIIGTRVAGTAKGYEETGMVEVGEYAAGLSYARKLTDKFTMGGQVRWAYQNLGENQVPETDTTTKMIKNEVSGLVYDFGTVFYPGFKSFRFGMSIRNFAKEFKYEEQSFPLPLTFRVGVAMDVLDFLGAHSNPLLVSIDAIHPRDYTERVNIGAEYILKDMLALRFGYRFNYDEESLTGGFGLNLNLGGTQTRVDYSYGALGDLGMVNRFALGFSL